MSDDPIASAAITPAPPGSFTVIPTVNTKKNVPMNSTTNFGTIDLFPPRCLQMQKRIVSLRRRRADFPPVSFVEKSLLADLPPSKTCYVILTENSSISQRSGGYM